MDAEAVQTYLDWLYTSTLNICPKIAPRTDMFNLVLLKLWAVANAVDDRAFKAKVIVTYFAGAHPRFSGESIKWAFVERKCDNEIRDFIIDMFLAGIEPGWFKNKSNGWPESFVGELADAAMVRWRDRKDVRTLKKMWMKKVGVEMEPVSDDEFTAPLSGRKDSAFAAPGIWRDHYRAADLDRGISGAAGRTLSRKQSGQKVEVKKRTHHTERVPNQDAHVLFLSDDDDDDGLVVLRSGG